MTASAGTTAPAAAPATDPRARFRDLLAAEWLKLWSLRSTPWSLLISGLAVIALNVGAAYDHYRYWHQQHMSPAQFIAHGLPLLDAFTTNAGLVMMIAAGATGSLVITSEYRTGLIRTTFAAVPARRPVMGAKTAVLATAMTAFGAVVAAISFLVTQAILAGLHAGVSISYPGALRVVAASALLAPLSALAGAAFGAVVRHSAAAAIATVAFLLVLPLIFSDGQHWSALLAHAQPYPAWMRLVTVPYPPVGTRFPWTIAGAWTVFAAWAVLAPLTAVAAVYRRDQ
jgi:ABC-2 type transport system permease protein